ncbi:hypothetical protein WISP_116776 [Willisornis vidua]|uniref:Uncharacterized protein n=1 Tax=Willisornis vidua TaxID=1566151 RepID=A0ABQ9CWR4_9PASS|nr:hypothetical protein WISP_116776 [Willisornis vidua]
MMLQRATADLDEENGIYIRYIDGSLFNLRQLKAHTKTLNHLVRNMVVSRHWAYSSLPFRDITVCPTRTTTMKELGQAPPTPIFILEMTSDMLWNTIGQ